MPDLKLLNLSSGRLQARPDIEMSFDGAGRFLRGPVILEGTDVAAQDAVRGLLTRKGTSPLAPNFGTSIPDLAGSRSVDDISGKISSEVRYILGYLAQRSADSPVTERIVEIVSLKVTPGNSESYQTDLTVRTGSGQTAAVTIA